MKKRTKIIVTYKKDNCNTNEKTFVTMKKVKSFVKQTHSANITRMVFIQNQYKIKVKTTNRFVWRNGKLYKCFGHNFNYDIWNSL
jgi:hypothetical protein